MKDLYNKSKDFRDYVNKYANTHHISVDAALEHNIVKTVGELTYTIDTFKENSIRQEIRNEAKTEH